jgi:rhamnosyltransferase
MKNMKEIKSIGVIIPTWNSKHHLKNCLPPLINSRLKPKILCIDSSSNDGTVEFARELGIDTIVIERQEFNHGLTREKARRYMNTDIIVMMTDDAYAIDNSLLETLVDPIINGKSSIAYARQLPRLGSNFFESFPREFNYPPKSHIRSILDIEKWGVYTFFCSNSCAAYLNSALDEIGGFPDVLFGEDTVCTAKLLRKGHKIAYVAEAKVRHSHNYSLKQEFQRYYTIGQARKSYQKLLECKASDNKRGASFFKEMMKRLMKEKPYLLPYAILHTAVKFVGYHLGKLKA